MRACAIEIQCQDSNQEEVATELIRFGSARVKVPSSQII